MKKILFILLFLSSCGHASSMADSYIGTGPNGLTLGLNYGHSLFAGRWGYEIGAAYSFGSVTGAAYSANVLLTFSTRFSAKHELVLKGGAAYWRRDLGMLSERLAYYNYGFSYFYTLKAKQAIGFDYYLNAYGIAYRYSF